MSSDDQQSEQTGLADTAAAPPESQPSQARSPSRAAQHGRVRAALFEGARLPPDEYEAGTVLGGRFRVVGLVGRGGMGEVYRARDLVLDEEVAIKFIPHNLAHDERFMTRFVREVRVARQITHPNVCRVHDIGEIDGRKYLSMEFIDGEDLASLLRRIGRLPLEKASELTQQLCAGLAALHDRKVLHRDLKPQNLMVDGRGELKITDFGLAAAAGELGEHEFRDGTPAYMAPEQAEGREVTHRSDLYALGLILYEVLTGRRPDRDGTSSGTDSTATPSVGSVVSGVPREVDDVIRACLEPNPADRPSSALVVAAALPGGDPIAAALAAGRTPSIDALLASKDGGTLSPTVGHLLVGLVLIALLGMAAAFGSSTVLGRSRSEAPRVLAHEARQILDQVAWSQGRFFEYSEIQYDRALIRQRRGHLDDRSVLLFQFRRQGPTFRPHRSLTMQDPGYDVPGGARVTLDGLGRLRSLLVTPAAGRKESDDEPDYAVLFEAAGLQLRGFETAEPTVVPKVFADHRRGWTGNSEALGEVRVEAASLGGRVVSFEVIAAWDHRFDQLDATPRHAGHGLELFAFVAVVLLIIPGMAWQARRVIQRGSADARGAARIATAVASVGLVVSVLQPDLAAGDYSVLGQQMLFVVGLGMFTYWAYLTVEPFSRRYLPGAMTSWVRLVRGRLRDPMVARDILLGLALAVAATTIERIGGAIDGVPTMSPATLRATNWSLGVLTSLTGPMFNAPLLFLLLAGLVRLVRRRWIASVLLVTGAASGFLVIATSAELGPALLVAMAVSGMLWGLTIVRVGLLGSVAFQLVRNIQSTLALTLDGDVWYAGSGWVGLACLLGLLAYGWRYGVSRPGTD